MPLLDAIRDQLNRQRLKSSGLVVAVSGGADSVALLRALAMLRSELELGPLVVAHLNHKLRGADSDDDEQFVCQLHTQLTEAGEKNMSLVVQQRDIAELAQQSGQNAEAVARRERYDFFSEVARTHGVAMIATAHTANDQAETVLHRLLRGTGLQGLRGIAARRELEPGLTLVRPMLSVTRGEVLAFLTEIGQSYREDRSNTDLRLTRNRIRHELLPLLERGYNPAIVSLLGRLADQASEMFDDIERQAQGLLQECELPPAGPLRVLDAERLSAAPRNLVREALRQLWQREDWSRDRLGYEDWDRIAAVAAGEILAVDLPGPIHVRRRGRVVQIGPPVPAAG